MFKARCPTAETNTPVILSETLMDRQFAISKRTEEAAQTRTPLGEKTPPGCPRRVQPAAAVFPYGTLWTTATGSPQPRGQPSLPPQWCRDDSKDEHEGPGEPEVARAQPIRAVAVSMPIIAAVAGCRRDGAPATSQMHKRRSKNQGRRRARKRRSRCS
jgi:hypothetical protein